MSLTTRLDALEGHQPRRCPTCLTWTVRVLYDDGPHTDWQGNVYPTPPETCPDCGRAVLTVNVVHIPGDQWQGRGQG